MRSDEILQAYINKMLTLQDEQREKPLTTQELKQIALDMGMSEEDWQASQKAFEGNLSSGKGHLTYRNWKDAVKELESAFALNPNSLDAAASLAQAYKGYWLETENDTYKLQAEKYAERALQIQPGHKATVLLLGELRQGEKEVAKMQTSRKFLLYGAVGLIVLIFSAFYLFVSNAVSSQKEEVKQKWAQVENVMERRASVIPSLVKVVKEAVKNDKEILNQVSQIESKNTSNPIDFNTISEDKLADYQRKQDELSASVKSLLDVASSNPKLSSSNAFRDLLAQVEGSDNRIFVERKKYNEAVGKYNAYIESFPANIFGYKAIPYLKMSKGAEKTPDMNF